MSEPHGRLDVGHLFFSSFGRMGRVPFVATILVVLALFAGFDLHAPGPVRGALGWLVDFLLFVAACSLIVKRLHDRGRSGWWSAVVMLAFANAWPQPEGLAGIAGAVVLALFAFDLALLPGQRQANRFGPPAGVLR